MQVNLLALICKVGSAMGTSCQRDNNCLREKRKKLQCSNQLQSALWLKGRMAFT